jgi:hypothetical protein
VNYGFIPPAGVLSYLGVAIRLELLRSNIEGQTGDKWMAQAIIVDTLRKFKEERAACKT